MANRNETEQRLEQWKRGFEKRMEELLLANPLPVPTPRGEYSFRGLQDLEPIII